MPVHYIPRPGRYARNEETGIVTPVQNIPIPLKYPAEFERCLMGGEAIIKGYYKSKPTVRKFPHFWIPTIRRMVIYSEILNQHMEVMATDRVLQLIHHYKGFDEYIMQVKLNLQQFITHKTNKISTNHLWEYFFLGIDKGMWLKNEFGNSDKAAND